MGFRRSKGCEETAAQALYHVDSRMGQHSSEPSWRKNRRPLIAYSLLGLYA
jgi:hypothetical protein